MPGVTYRPREGQDGDLTEVRGVVFEAGQSVDVKDEALFEKLKGHPEFEVADAEKAPDDQDRKESEQRLAKALDGRTKAAREAKAKADEARVEEQAKERARVQAEGIRAARAAPVTGATDEEDGVNRGPGAGTTGDQPRGPNLGAEESKKSK